MGKRRQSVILDLGLALLARWPASPKTCDVGSSPIILCALPFPQGIWAWALLGSTLYFAGRELTQKGQTIDGGVLRYW